MCDLYVSLEACYGDPAWYVCAFIYVGCALGLGFYGGALGGDLQCGNKVHFFVVFNTLCSICRMCLVALALRDVGSRGNHRASAQDHFMILA